MDTSQIIISVCLLLVSITLVVVGIYFISLLIEAKTSLKKINLILETTQVITDAVATPVSSFSEFIMGFKNGFTVFNKFFKNNKDV